MQEIPSSEEDYDGPLEDEELHTIESTSERKREQLESDDSAEDSGVLDSPVLQLNRLNDLQALFNKS